MLKSLAVVWHPRHIRWWQWLALLLLGIGFVVRSWFPEFLRQQIVTQLASLTPAQVQLGDVDIDLLRGHIALQQLSFTLDGDTQPVLAIDDLAINASLRALLRREIDIEDVHMSGVQVLAVQDANGQFNLSRIFLPSPSEPEQPPSDLPALTIRRARIADSQLIYHDRTRTPEARFPLAIAELTTTDVTLQANGLAAPVTVKLDSTLDNSPLNGEARLLWQREQTSIEAKVEAKQLALAMIEPYLRDVLTVQKVTGQLGTSLQYRYHSGTASPQHFLSGTVDVSHLQFVDPALGQTGLEIPNGQIKIESIDFLSRNLRFQTVELRNPKLLLVNGSAGLNAALWVRTAEASPSSSPQKYSSSPWKFALPTVKWTGGELVYRDSRWLEKEMLTLRPEEIVVERLGSEMKELPFQFRTRAGDGKIAGTGRVQLSPFGLQLSLQPDELEIATLQPLLTPILAAKQVQGKVTGTLQTDITEQEGKQIIRTHGVVETRDFILNDTPEQGEAVGWQQGKLEIGQGSTLSPFSLHLKPDLAQVTLKRSASNSLIIEKATGELRLAQASTPEQQQKVTIAGVLDTTKLTLNGLPEAANVLTWDSGQIELREGSTLVPLALKLKTQVSQLALRQLPQGDVTIEKANGDLRLVQESGEQQASVLKAHGPIEFTSFALTQGEEKQILLGCYHGKATISEGSRVLPLDIKLRDVALEYTYAQGMRPPAGQFQLFIPPVKARGVNIPSTTSPQAETRAVPDTSSVAPTSQPTAPLASSASPETPTANASIQIDRVTIIGGQLYFEDRTVSPPQTVYWQDVRVDLSRAGYPTLLPTTFTAFAYNEDGAPVEFKGTTERKGEQAVVRVHGKVEKMSLSRFNSYLEPSLGYRVKKGAVSATWDLVLPGDRVQANMKVTLHDINLGSKQKASELEQQVGLPLALVIALLKDLNGDISLQLPMEGRVNEPGFQLSGTVVRAVRDVLIGAVTSPLKVLGALFKGKDKLAGFTLEPIRFTPGTRQIAENSHEQLSRLALFLTQRPKLDLRLGGVTGMDDLELLRDQLILNQMPVKPSPSGNEGDAAPLVTPQDEVRQFLAKRLLSGADGAISPLSSQATDLLTRLRKEAKVSASETERLADDRVQVVIAELTTRHAITADRLHVSPEKQRGSGSAEVRYTIQTREEKESSQ